MVAFGLWGYPASLLRGWVPARRTGGDMILASAGLASANRGLPMNEAARLSRQSGQLPTPSSVIPAEQAGLLKSP